MSEEASGKIESVPPQVQLMQIAVQMLRGHVGSRLLYVAAKLSLADCLAEGPRNAEQLAEQTGTHAPSLYRVMRALTNLGLFTEDSKRCFSLTPMGEMLKTGAPGSVRGPILIATGDLTSSAVENLLYAVQTGKTGFEKAFGISLFDWLGNHPEEASVFSEAMVLYHGAEPPAVASAYDFSEFKTIVDVGGATGNFLAAILGRYLGPRGIYFSICNMWSVTRRR